MPNEKTLPLFIPQNGESPTLQAAVQDTEYQNFGYFPPVKLLPNWEPFSSSGVGCGLWEGEADVMVVQPIDVLVIAANTGQSSQAGRAISTPTHTVMLLPVGN